MKVLVTGADGFVGAPLCERLSQEGHDVIAATRSPAAFGSGIRNVAVGDLRGEVRWTDLRGCEAVVHLAAHVHRVGRASGDDGRDCRATNVDATSRLMDAAKREGVRRVIHLSTIKVHGERTRDRPFDETSPLHPSDEYARSKCDAEDIVRGSGLESVVLRPPLVYGPRVKANFLRLLEAVSNRRAMPLAAIDNRRSLVYVGNLVDAIARSLTAELPREATFVLRDGEDVSTPGLVRRLGAAMGSRPLLLPIPPVVLRLAGVLVGRRGQVSRLVESLQVDDGRIRRALDWVPPFRLDEGLQATADWFLRRTP